MIRRLFLNHPRSVGEGYLAHAGVAARTGGAMVAAGLGCLVHAVVPALCTTTGSDAIRRLHARLGERRSRAVQGPANGSALSGAGHAVEAPAGPWQLNWEI